MTVPQLSPGYDLYILVLTVLFTAGVVVAILLFERKRAEQIKRDLRGQEHSQGKRSGEDDHA